MALDLFKRGFEQDNKSGTQLSDWKWLVQYGTLVRKQGTAENAETTIHTVTAGKKLYIFAIAVGAQNNAALSNIPTCSLEINDIEAVAANPNLQIDGHEYISMSFAVPIEVAAGQTIQVTSNRVGCFARGSVHGYEI